MKQYYQGTLDFACGIYAVLNALSLTHQIGLEQARSIYSGVMLELSTHEVTWKKFLLNQMNHYGLVRHVLKKYCMDGPYKCHLVEPFGDYFSECIEQSFPFEDFHVQHNNLGDVLFRTLKDSQVVIWNDLQSWFNSAKTSNRTAVVRFNRFMLGASAPYVSHWTTVKYVSSTGIELFDASAEKMALHHIERSQMLGSTSNLPSVMLEPASVILLESMR